MRLHLVHPRDQRIEMTKDEWGYFSIQLSGLPADARYYYSPDNSKDLPDPVSHFQPLGVFGPSQVVDHSSFQWNDQNWHGLPFDDLIFYEVHVGTFSDEGTFEAIISRLDDLKEIGINTIELMPIAQFSGSRNWGYDGVFPFAVQNSYGGPDGLKKLVDACHQREIAVFLDVVYNHVGPEGNVLHEFAPYFTDRYKTPWGNAINFDDAYADGVREYIVSNLLYWFETYHFDGLRLDAIHAMYDSSAVSIWELIHQEVKKLEQKMGRSFYLVAESDLNSPRVIKPVQEGGYGFNAQWLDDFHHALYVLLDKKGKERYEDFGRLELLAKAYTHGFVLSGHYVRFRKRKFGASSGGISGNRFIAFNMNHDQVGNRVGGERLSQLLNFDQLKLAAATLLLAPYVPMLFMGEEYGDDTPFYYFVDHQSEELIKAVSEGRKKEFAAFSDDGKFKEAHDPTTFHSSRINWSKRKTGYHAILLEWHKRLIHLRRIIPALKNFDKENVLAYAIDGKIMIVHRQHLDEQSQLVILSNFSENPMQVNFPDYLNPGFKILDSMDSNWLIEVKHSASSLPPIIEPHKKITLLPWQLVAYTSHNPGKDL